MCFRSSLARPAAQGGAGAAWAAAICAALVIGIGLYPAPLIAKATQASQAAQVPLQPPTRQIAGQ